jgi:MFS family permease
MSYGIGFSVGPLGINLLPLGEWAPFLANGLLFAVVILLMVGVPAAQLEPAAKTKAAENRFITVYRAAWFALIPSLVYGIMEASMSSSFPLYALRISLNEDWISILLLAFGIGSLILQLPLGTLSDRIGRKPVLIACGMIGGVCFLAVPAAGNRIWLLCVLFVVAGGVVGSFFSLGLAYAADVLPRAVLPAANLAASVHFSIGSILGPAMGGYGIRYVSAHSIFLFLGFAHLLFALSGFLFRPKADPVVET